MVASYGITVLFNFIFLSQWIFPGMAFQKQLHYVLGNCFMVFLFHENCIGSAVRLSRLYKPTHVFMKFAVIWYQVRGNSTKDRVMSPPSLYLRPHYRTTMEFNFCVARRIITEVSTRLSLLDERVVIVFQSAVRLYSPWGKRATTRHREFLFSREIVRARRLFQTGNRNFRRASTTFKMDTDEKLLFDDNLATKMTLIDIYFIIAIHLP